jgi:hypothetical protein
MRKEFGSDTALLINNVALQPCVEQSYISPSFVPQKTADLSRIARRNLHLANHVQVPCWQSPSRCSMPESGNQHKRQPVGSGR